MPLRASTEQAPVAAGQTTRLQWMRQCFYRSRPLRSFSFMLVVGGWSSMWASALAIIPIPPVSAAAAFLLGIALIPLSSSSHSRATISCCANAHAPKNGPMVNKA